MITECMV